MKKRFKLFIVCVALFSLNVTKLCANPLDNNNAIGWYIMSLGSSDYALYGLQYQRGLTDKVGLVICGSVMADESNNKTIMDFNANMELDISLVETSWGEHFGSRFGAFFLAGYRGHNGPSTLVVPEIDIDTGVSYNTTKEGPFEYYGNVVAAIGMEFEFFLVEHISIPIKLGLSGEFPKYPSAGVCGGIGIRYSF